MDGGRGDGHGIAAPAAHGEALEDVVVHEAAVLAARGVAVAVLRGGLAGGSTVQLREGDGRIIERKVWHVFRGETYSGRHGLGGCREYSRYDVS